MNGVIFEQLEYSVSDKAYARRHGSPLYEATSLKADENVQSLSL